MVLCVYLMVSGGGQDALSIEVFAPPLPSSTLQSARLLLLLKARSLSCDQSHTIAYDAQTHAHSQDNAASFRFTETHAREKRERLVTVPRHVAERARVLPIACTSGARALSGQATHRQTTTHRRAPPRAALSLSRRSTLSQRGAARAAAAAAPSSSRRPPRLPSQQCAP